MENLEVSEKTVLAMRGAQKQPMQLTKKQLLELVFKSKNLGHPKRLSKPKRGMQSTKNQYDIFFERRKGLYHRFIRLPESGNYAKTKRSKQFIAVVERALSELPQGLRDECERHKINGWVVSWLKLRELPVRHRTTIFRAIKKLPPIGLQQ
jgi:hypothetical protein